MKTIAIIPARLAATRFPNKPLATIQGMPMIGHCYIRSKLCTLLDETYVATCDTEIKEYIESIGGKAIMTADVHERATERTAEALVNIEALQPGTKYDIIVMVQGDEPLVDPDMLREAIEPLLNGDKMVSNLMASLPTQDEHENPNNVKVVTNIKGEAIYMSREPIPSRKKFKGEIPAFRQLGLIAFTREALLKFVALPTTPFEIIESVDMNRLIENGVPIFMTATKYLADSVDTVEDLSRVEEKMKKDILFQTYKNQIKA
jgi:3-deoxy-manno-octulosonate cytidylyltransferase (CMP-KDO synthetase)